MSLDASIEQARQRIRQAYDPELFRAAGHRLVDLLSANLAAAERSAGKVLPWRDPAENVREAAEMLRGGKGDSPHLPERPFGCSAQMGTVPFSASRDDLSRHFAALVETMLCHGHNLHDPRYIGHQVAASVPLAGWLDAVGSVTNQAMAIYDMGPWATAAEWAMVACLGQKIGFAAGTFAGLATHGGSLANLTALLTARNVTCGDAWKRGVPGGDARPVMVVHADAHYSVARAAGILGIGTEQVIRVGLDARRRMDLAQLDATLGRLQSQRRPVVAVVACACSTPVGAFDQLDGVADLCRRYGVWLHVDAAHGGSACLSPRHRHLIAGLQRADSLVWDAHKMLFMPALCAFVFYREAAHRFEAFRQDAPYLFDPAAPGIAEFDSGLRSVECTKRAAAFGLWGIWSLFGEQLFADLVDTTFALGRVFYEKLQAADDFLPLHEPECNIVVFRHVPAALRDAPPDVLGQFQFELRRRVIESGEFYIVSTKLDGVGALRVTIINPLTGPEHLDALLDTLRRHGRELQREMGRV